MMSCLWKYIKFLMLLNLMFSYVQDTRCIFQGASKVNCINYTEVLVHSLFPQMYYIVCFKFVKGWHKAIYFWNLLWKFCRNLTFFFPYCYRVTIYMNSEVCVIDHLKEWYFLLIYSEICVISQYCCLEPFQFFLSMFWPQIIV